MNKEQGMMKVEVGEEIFNNQFSIFNLIND
jgi:hypothetical protein